METQNQSKLKLRISRMFRSCKSASDVIERPPPPPSSINQPLIELFSPKVEPCRRKKWSKVVETVDQNCTLAKDRIFPTKRSSNCQSPKCPPASPIKERRRSQKKQRKSPPANLNMDKYYEFFSSEGEEDDGTRTLFSSRSLSSDSSDYVRKDKKKKKKNRVKNSLVVVKKSTDPYTDFRNSMVEMIVEKQILDGRDLENLLQTFLSLNSSHHHKVIIEVYTEIWETLFSILY